MICHSLGCHAVNELLSLGYQLPDSIKEIRFYQADVETIFPDQRIINYHSPYDPVLIAANLANLRNVNAGMFGDPNHDNNIKLDPNPVRSLTGNVLINAHLDSVNSIKITKQK